MKTKNEKEINKIMSINGFKFIIFVCANLELNFWATRVVIIIIIIIIVSVLFSFILFFFFIYFMKNRSRYSNLLRVCIVRHSNCDNGS